MRYSIVGQNFIISDCLKKFFLEIIETITLIESLNIIFIISKIA